MSCLSECLEKRAGPSQGCIRNASKTSLESQAEAVGANKVFQIAEQQMEDLEDVL